MRNGGVKARGLAQHNVAMALALVKLEVQGLALIGEII